LFSSLALSGDTTDFYEKQITKIDDDNCVLHNPQYKYNWSIDRFVDSSTDNVSSYEKKSTYLNLVMLPTSVPASQVSPSLIPLTCSNLINFDVRENDARRTTYTNFGSRGDVTQATTATALTLVSNRWVGGTRPPQFASSNDNDPYDTIRAGGDTFFGYASGTIDVQVPYAPSLAQLTIIDSAVSGALQSVSYAPPIGQVQSLGIAMFPASKDNMVDEIPTLTENRLQYQQPIDPSSINCPIPAGKFEEIRWYGRRAITESPARGPAGVGTADGICHINEHADEDKNYMGYYGWRFISAFQMTDFSSRQTYNPVILDPNDELILGLDAGTFGPPDLDTDDLPGDGQGPGDPAGSEIPGRQRGTQVRDA
jgi:hypothetical protein